MSQSPDKTECPYCHNPLEEIPKRSKKCPFCGKTYFVRKSIVVTEDEANIQDWINRLGSLDVTRNEFDKSRIELSKKFGFLAPVNDTIWKILNKKAGSRNYSIAINAYYEMARLVETENKDPKPYIVQALRQNLLELKSEGITKVRIFGYGGSASCPECIKLMDKEFDIDYALDTMPIPSNCTEKRGCLCSYASAHSSEELAEIWFKRNLL